MTAPVVSICTAVCIFLGQRFSEPKSLSRTSLRVQRGFHDRSCEDRLPVCPVGPRSCRTIGCIGGVVFVAKRKVTGHLRFTVASLAGPVRTPSGLAATAATVYEGYETLGLHSTAKVELAHPCDTKQRSEAANKVEPTLSQKDLSRQMSAGKVVTQARCLHSSSSGDTQSCYTSHWGPTSFS